MDTKMIWLILFLPLIGSVIQALFGKKIIDTMGVKKGKWVCGLLAVAPIFIAFVIGFMITQGLMANPGPHAPETLFDWISVNGLRIPFEAIIDPLSMTMVLIITGIGALIHLYATGYMAEEREYSRFFTYLNLFVASMLILVLGNNLALMFIGWEGVGLCSYLLIGFWYKDVNNAKAANKAFIVNRIGDWGLTLGIFMLVAVMLTSGVLPKGETRLLSYDVILPHAQAAFQGKEALAVVVGLLLFVGACGKSAQFPLYLWLPDAMAGPTPVSALIHAATMVTSGVFLLNRMNIIYQIGPAAGAVVAIVGAITALLGALIAFGQTDIKKVLAYSTVSQLGFMFIACGSGAYWAGMFHVTTHAFFKALLFLGSGAVIHAMAHEQDMRNYGKLAKYVKITFACMAVGWLAIAGVPGLSGFYSKEAILGAALAQNDSLFNGVNLGRVAGWIGLAAAFLTAFYMTRMMCLTFWGKEELWRKLEPHPHHDEDHHEVHVHHAHDHGPDTNGFFFTDEELAAHHEEHEHHHSLDRDHTPREVPPSMWVPLVVLALFSIGFGYFASRPAGGEEVKVFQNWLYPAGSLQLHEIPAEPHEIPLTMLSLAAALGGIIASLAWYLGVKGGRLPVSEGWDMRKWNPLRRAALNQFGYDSAMVTATTEGGGQIAEFVWKRVDVGIVDWLVNGTGRLMAGFGRVFSWFQTGYVRAYALMMLAGVAGFLIYTMATIKSHGFEGASVTQAAPVEKEQEAR
jgi:NADH-quinone oxidoreductase subunit L